MASTTLDLPDPLGPTTTVTPGSRVMVVGSANDLNPLRVRLFRNTACPKLVEEPLTETLPLASRTEMRRTLGRYRPSDPALAARETALPRAAVHLVGLLVRAAVSVEVDVLAIAEGRPTRRHGGVEDAVDGGVQPPFACGSQLVGHAVGSQA